MTRPRRELLGGVALAGLGLLIGVLGVVGFAMQRPAVVLGGVDMQTACDVQYPDEQRDAIRGDDAYSWTCAGPTGVEGGIEVQAECVRVYGPGTKARAASSDPDSWVCER
jgi:hypothetical protein